MLDGCAAIQPVRVPQIDVISTQALQAILARLADVCGVATEPEVAVSEADAAELGCEEDVGSLAGLREPFSDEVFRISLARR